MSIEWLARGVKHKMQPAQKNLAHPEGMGDNRGWEERRWINYAG